MYRIIDEKSGAQNSRKERIEIHCTKVKAGGKPCSRRKKRENTAANTGKSQAIARKNVGKKCDKNPEIPTITHVRQQKTGWQKPKP